MGMIMLEKMLEKLLMTCSYCCGGDGGKNSNNYSNYHTYIDIILAESGE